LTGVIGCPARARAREESAKMYSKEHLQQAYRAGLNYAVMNPPEVEDDGFEEWFEREIANPPEGCDDHHD
jgi:hypothetical protein